LSYAIRSQHVLQADGSWQAGIVQVADGQVVALQGSDGEVGEMPVYDLHGAYVTPGLVSAHGELATALWNDRQEFADSGTVRAADVYDPKAAVVQRLVAGGFLRVAHSPSKSRVLAGQLSELRLGTMQGVVNAELAELVVLSGAARSRDRFPASLAGQIQLVNNAWQGEADKIPLFLPAAALSVFEQAQVSRREQISRGDRRVVFHAESDAEATAAIKLAETWKLAGSLLAPDQLEPIMSQLSAAKMAVIARPSRASDYHWYARDLVKANQVGVQIGLSGNDPLMIRQTVAEAVRFGLPDTIAMQWLTNGSARAAGMSESAGQLVVGSRADLVVWSGSPVHLAAKPLAVIVDGKFVEEK
jgi:imidazolonepropionase-like amidohydrolase